MKHRLPLSRHFTPRVLVSIAVVCGALLWPHVHSAAQQTRQEYESELDKLKKENERLRKLSQPRPPAKAPAKKPAEAVVSFPGPSPARESAREPASEPAPAPTQVPAGQPEVLKMDGLSAEQVKAGQQAWARSLGLPVVFQDAMKSGGQGPEMVVIPAGEFTIGSGEEERKKYVEAGGKQAWADREKPVSGVRLGAYAMGQTEVTVGQYTAFVKATGYSGSKGCYVRKDGVWQPDEQADWSKPGFDQRHDHPVVCVSWKDAKAYVAWLSQETGKEYRLASEAEWENGARAGTRTRRYWGDDWADDQACDYANGADLSSKEKINWAQTFNCRDGAVYTAGVKGNRKPNALGLYDMLGNACEWVEDCFVDSYAGLSKEGKPQRCAQGEARRVVRGGAWGNDPGGLRSADRSGNSPGSRIDYTGFRLARTL